MRTREITEGAMMAAIMVILLLIGYFLPLGILATIFGPIPVAVAYLRNGRRSALVTLLVATFLISILLHPLAGLVYGGGLGLVGLAFGYGVSQGRALAALGWMSAAFLVMMLFSGLVLFLFAGGSPMAELMMIVEHSREQAVDIYRTLGADPELIAEAEDRLDRNIEMLKLYFPAGLLLGAMGSVFLNYQVGRRVLQRLGLDAPELPTFSSWRFPPAIVLGYALGFVLSSFVRSGPLADLSAFVGANLLLVFSAVFLVQGLALVYYLMERIRLPKFFRWIGVFYLVIVPALSQLGVWLGMADMAFDLRRFRFPGRPEES